MKKTRTLTNEIEMKSGVREEISTSQNGEAIDMDVFESDLRCALKQVESTAPVSPPQLEQMIRLVEDTNRRQSRILQRDLALFIMIAVCAGVGWVISAILNYFVDVLIATSFVSIATIPVGWLLARREVRSS
ncbi:DUF5345 family protein [Alicyclobacillus fodiniaquatilis]|uniref:DUF5345 family protein n=1 Tax=Alicyclobacillus fodiniaquatilis TaxID=1661150 RepID=A0ABW4JJQ7_9BACL